MMKIIGALMLVFTMVLSTIMFASATPVCAASYNVTTVNNDGPGSLRQAIIDANNSAGTDTITFNIPGSGPYTIQPASALPTITDAVIIDGITQPGFAGTPLIELDGTNAGSGTDGLRITAGGSTIRGLVINNFQGIQEGNGIELSINGGNVIEGNYIGTNVTGTQDRGNQGTGIRIISGNGNMIGGTEDAQRNVISGNDNGGIVVDSGDTNRISGNYIGINASGTASIGNSHGISTSWQATNTTIVRNVISGNNDFNSGGGITISSSNGTIVQGNYIGTDALGVSSLPNKFGIFLGNVATNCLIGGTDASTRNIISGNVYEGIQIMTINDPLNNNQIFGNYIGTDVTGTRDLGNQSGIYIHNTCHIRIGGTGTGQGNLISGNGDGIVIDNTTGSVFSTQYNSIEGNLIGTNASGTGVLGNDGAGIKIDPGASRTTIGGISAGARNIVSGNSLGIVLLSDENVVQGNYIGTDISGTADLGNTYWGVDITPHFPTVSNIIGGTVPGEGNIIAYNGAGIVSRGYELYGYTTKNAFLGNSIHDNIGLGIDLSNTLDIDGVTANDAGDLDTGANNLQNYPVLTSVVRGVTSTTIEGALNSTPSTQFRLEFFSSTTADASVYGEGETYLGTETVTTDGSGTVNFSVTLPLTVAKEKAITATATDPDNNTSEFSSCISDHFDLTMVVDGNGSVTPSEGVYYYPIGTVVDVAATPDVGWRFSGWSANVVNGKVTMNAPKTVTATFTPIDYTLTASISPADAETAGCEIIGNDVAYYHYGDLVNLTAIEVVGWTFKDWTGDYTNNDTPLSFNMPDHDVTVTASFTHFTQDQYTLSFNITGNGSITPNVAGPYIYGTVVTLTPSADPGWTFGSFGANVNASNQVTINANTTVDATFTLIECRLTINITPTGSGTVSKNPNQTTYHWGNVVTLTPAAGAGWNFVSFSGDTNTNSITMNDNKTVTATFAMKVTIDIQPGTSPNKVNLDSKGVIPVAILTTLDFDATQVDVSTVRFGPGQVAPSKYLIKDVNKDGKLDLMLQFDNLLTGLAKGAIEATITAQTSGGMYIIGTDSVVIVPPKKE